MFRSSVYAAATPDIKQTLGLIIGVLAFILFSVLTYLVLKWLSKRGFSGIGSKHMKVIDRLMVSRDSYFVLLQVGERVLLVSVCKEGSSTLCELSAEDLLTRMPEKEIKDKDNVSFGKRMAHNLKLNMGLLPKGTKPLGPSSAKTKNEEPTPEESARRFQMVLERIQSQQNKATDNEDPIFAAVENGGGSGYGYVENKINGPGTPERSAGNQIVSNKRDYQSEIENMKKNSKIHERSVSTSAVSPAVQTPPQNIRPVPLVSAGQAYSAYKTSAAQGIQKKQDEILDEKPAPESAGMAAVNKKQDADDKIDMMFDMIAKRQSRYKGEHRKESP